MSRFDARLAKLEATMGNADESRYWQAVLDLQPKLRALHRQSREEGWPIMRFLEQWREMHKGLPPAPDTAEHRLRMAAGKTELFRRLEETRERMEASRRLLALVIPDAIDTDSSISYN